MAVERVIYDRNWSLDSNEFLSLAEQLDCSLNNETMDMLLEAQKINSFQKRYAKMEFIPVGSSQDGSKVTTPVDGGDVDILLIPQNILLSQSLFEYDQDYPAFLHVRGNGEHAKYFEGCNLIENKWVPVNALKEYAHQVMHMPESYVRIHQSKVNIFHESAVGIEFSTVDDSTALAEQTLIPEKISCTYSNTKNEIENIQSPKIIQYDKQENLKGIKTGERKIDFNKKMSADLVPAFSFKGWPYTAMDWMTRKRSWPPEDVVKTVLNTGCQIVSKRPMFPHLEGDPENEDHSPEANAKDTYFRLSFARCELVLSKSLTEPQKLCWRVFKAYQKKYLHTKPRVLSSYHWKNVVFWISEETEVVFWSSNNVLSGVIKGLDFMQKCLEKRFVPLYFVRNENLISGCREDMISEAISRLNQIRSSPLDYLRSFIRDPPGPEPCAIMLKTIQLHEERSEDDLKIREYVYNPSNMDDLKRALKEMPQMKEDLMECIEELDEDNDSDNTDDNEFVDNVNFVHFIHEYMKALVRLQTKPSTETITSVEKSEAGRLAISILSELLNADYSSIVDILRARQVTDELEVTKAFAEMVDLTEQNEETPQNNDRKKAYAKGLRRIVHGIKGDILRSDIDRNNILSCNAETKKTLMRRCLQAFNQANEKRAARKLDTDIPLD